MQLSIFDTMEEYKPIKPTDWKWTMAKDYPEKNGLKVFSCFACGGAAQWVINSLVAKCLAVAKLTRR